MTPPRQIIAGQTVLLTVQATGRMFRFLPTKRVSALIWYVFAAALVGFKIDVHEFCFLSNHFHIVMTPREANLPAFTQKFHSQLSRALNAVRRQRGSNIEDEYSVVVETDPDAILRHCAYTLANPVAANLVTHIRRWKGPNSFALEYGEEVVLRRPKTGLWRPVDTPATRPRRKRRYPVEPRRRSYRGRWTSPEQVSFRLVRPPVALGEMGDAELRAEVRRRARVREEAADTKRVEAGRKAMGMRKVLKQKWNDYPGVSQEMFGLRPKFASSSRWAKLSALQRSRAFVVAYRDALREWLAGNREVEFPAGTYLMRTRFDVCCAPAPPA